MLKCSCSVAGGLSGKDGGSLQTVPSRGLFVK